MNFFMNVIMNNKGPCYNVLITNSVGAGLHVGAYSSYTEGTGVKYSIVIPRT